MKTETIFLGHDNKRDITEPSEFVEGKRVVVGEEVQCPRCSAWTYFKGHAHGVLNPCVGGVWLEVWNARNGNPNDISLGRMAPNGRDNQSRT